MLGKTLSQALDLCDERVSDTGRKSVDFAPLASAGKKRAVMARVLCMEIYRSENDRVERLDKRGFFTV